MAQESAEASGTGLFCRVGLENFKEEIRSEERPVLLLCTPEDTAFTARLAEMDKMQLAYRQALNVCFLEEGFAVYSWSGIRSRDSHPAVFLKWTEWERLLGRISYDDVVRFIQ